MSIRGDKRSRCSAPCWTAAVGGAPPWEGGAFALAESWHRCTFTAVLRGLGGLSGTKFRILLGGHQGQYNKYNDAVRVGKTWPRAARYLVCSLNKPQLLELVGSVGVLFPADWAGWPELGNQPSQVIVCPKETDYHIKQMEKCERVRKADGVTEQRDVSLRSWLHYDLTSSLLCVTAGTKTVYLAKDCYDDKKHPKQDQKYKGKGGSLYLESSGEKQFDAHGDLWLKIVVPAGFGIHLPARCPHDVISVPGTLAFSIDVK